MDSTTKRLSSDVDSVRKKSKKHKRDHSSCSSNASHEEHRHKHKKRKHKRSSSPGDNKIKPHRHKKKKHKKKKSKSSHKSDKELKEANKAIEESTGTSTDDVIGPSLSEAQKVKGPMTKEDWEKQQSVVKRVFDPETGRNRLVKGDGEILEEIVSKEQHRKINKEATFHDGEYFKKQLGLQ